MVEIPSIPIALERANGLLTLEGGSVNPGTPVIVLKDGGEPGDNEWLFRPSNRNENTYIIENLKSRTSLSFEGVPGQDTLLTGEPRPREWTVEKIQGPPGSLIAFLRLTEDPDLVVDEARFGPGPAHHAILKKKREGNEQVWIFRFHE